MQSRERNVIWPQVTGTDPEVMSFDRKSPASGCRKPKTGVCWIFDFLQDCSSQEEAVTWEEMTSRDLRCRKWPEGTSFHWKSSGSGCKSPKTDVYCAFDFLQGCSSQEDADTWNGMSFHLKWPEVTRKWCHLTGSHLQVAVESLKPTYPVRLTFYKAVARRRRQSPDRKWHHVTSGDRKWHRSDVI